MRLAEVKPLNRQRLALSKIPVFPPIAIRALCVLSEEDTDIRQLFELLRVDPAFSGEILRIANSPLFGFKSRIDSLQHALVILGLRRTKALTLTVATSMYLKGMVRMDVFRNWWRYSLACALLAEELARACSLQPDRAYTAALLSDIGRLGLIVAYPAEYTHVMAEARDRAESGHTPELLALERDAIGMDHCEAGRFLAAKWNLPEEFRVVVSLDEQAPGAGDLTLPRLVFLASQLATSMGFNLLPIPGALSLEEVRAGLPPLAQDRLRMEPDKLKQYIEYTIENYDIRNFDPRSVQPSAQSQTLARGAPNTVLPIAARQVEREPDELDEMSHPDAERFSVLEVVVFLFASTFFCSVFLVMLLYFWPN